MHDKNFHFRIYIYIYRLYYFNKISIKFIVCSGPWELEIPTNVVIFERSPSTMSQPHPDIEFYRGHLVAKLRQCYQELCQSRESKYCDLIL